MQRAKAKPLYFYENNLGALVHAEIRTQRPSEKDLRLLHLHGHRFVFKICDPRIEPLERIGGKPLFKSGIRLYPVEQHVSTFVKVQEDAVKQMQHPKYGAKIKPLQYIDWWDVAIVCLVPREELRHYDDRIRLVNPGSNKAIK